MKIAHIDQNILYVIVVKTHTFVVCDPYRAEGYNLIKILLKDLLALRREKNRDNLPGGLDREYEPWGGNKE